MNAARNLLGRLGVAVCTEVLDRVVDPGVDPLPAQGTRLLGRQGRVWQVEDHGIRRVDKGEHVRPWHRWNSPQARAVGPFVNPSAVTPRRSS